MRNLHSTENIRDVDDNYTYKTFIFNLNGDSSFEFRLVFSVDVFSKHEKVNLTVLGEERICKYWDKSQSSTYYIAKWVEEDYRMIFSELLKRITEEFSAIDYTINDRTRIEI